MLIKNHKGNELHSLVKEKINAYSREKLPKGVETEAEEYMGSYLFDAYGNMIGGIVGHSFWNILHIDYFWVDESLRGQGKGSQLLESIENFAKEEKCRVIHLETFSFEAPSFYEKHGYREFERIPDVIAEGIDYYFFKKML